MDYESSTHVNKWTFTSDQLTETRTRANNEAYEYTQQRQAAIKQQKQELSTDTTNTKDGNVASTPNPLLSPPIAKCFAKGYQTTGTITSNVDPSKFPTPSEEETMIDFYAEKLLTLIGPQATISKLKRDIKVASTASLLLRRFFLSNSIVLFDPKAVMVACAFLSSKVEDATCDIRYLEDGTKAMSAHVKIKEIIEAEVALVKGVDFDLCCFHPYKVVLAYTEDLRTFLKSKDGKNCVNMENREVVSGEDLVPIYNRARQIVEHVVFHSDMMLRASPGKVGLVAMMLANEELVEKHVAANGTDTSVLIIDFKEYITCRFANEKKVNDIETLWHRMEELLIQMKGIVNKSSTDMIALKGIHKKLKKCRIWGSTDDKKKKKKRKRNEDDTSGAAPTSSGDN